MQTVFHASERNANAVMEFRPARTRYALEGEPLSEARLPPELASEARAAHEEEREFAEHEAATAAARGAAPELCALIAAGESWRRWPFFVRPALTRWSYGAVTLLGDAAHPMPPFLAQGAAQAIEDAEALGRAFAAAPDAPVARIFAAYEQARIARASRVARASRRQGDLDHLGGLAAAVRDLGIRALGGRGLLLRNAWLYR